MSVFTRNSTSSTVLLSIRMREQVGIDAVYTVAAEAVRVLIGATRVSNDDRGKNNDTIFTITTLRLSIIKSTIARYPNS